MNFCFKLLIITIVLLSFSCNDGITLSPYDDGLAPAVPSGIYVVLATDGSIVLRWNDNLEPDFSSYSVYRSVNDTFNFEQVRTVFSAFFREDALHYDSIYYYKIKSIDNSKRESVFSYPISATPENRYAPGTPLRLSVFGLNNEGKLSIDLTWVPPFDRDIAFFEIYRDTVISFIPDTLYPYAIALENYFTDTVNLVIDKNYYYVIRTVDNGSLKSAFSGYDSDIINKLAAQVFPSNGEITDYFVNFSLISINKPANYTIYLYENPSTSAIWSKVFTSSAINDTIEILFNAPFIYPDVKYYWRVVTHSKDNGVPNSISPVTQFRLK